MIKKLPPNKPNVSNVQRVYLQRLKDAARAKPKFRWPAKPLPVRQADRIITAWNNARHREEAYHRRSISQAHDKVAEAILFMTPEKALAAVVAFERWKP